MPGVSIGFELENTPLPDYSASNEMTKQQNKLPGWKLKSKCNRSHNNQTINNLGPYAGISKIIKIIQKSRVK